MSSILIRDERELAEFRSTRLSVDHLGPYIEANRVVLVNAPVGTGKSRALDDLIDHYLRHPMFDLIVVLAALTANLLERRLVRSPTPEVRRLRPRPGADCGPLDPAWRAHERGGTTAYAKQHLCGACQHF